MEGIGEHNDNVGLINWYYEKGGQRVGGVTESEIIELIKESKLQSDSLVWRSGLTDWMELRRTELAPYIDRTSPPSLPATHVNNTVAWILAFAILIGEVLRGFFLGLIHLNNQWELNQAIKNGDLWYLTILLNIGLCCWDSQRLKAAGIDTDKFKGWVWLVPVYLYCRAKTLHQKGAYFWVWMACFVLELISR
jgi:hypothetical protein